LRAKLAIHPWSLGHSYTIAMNCNEGPGGLPGPGCLTTPQVRLETDKERSAMNCGYTFLWRKTWTNPILQEKGKKFSRFEAWLHLTNVLATGADDPAAGLRRGEFRASVRRLDDMCRVIKV
jgi:hypothetical protein